MNKINGPWFSKFDEDLATAFSIYCGISIAHVSGSFSSQVEPSSTRIQGIMSLLKLIGVFMGHVVTPWRSVLEIK